MKVKNELVTGPLQRQEYLDSMLLDRLTVDAFVL